MFEKQCLNQFRRALDRVSFFFKCAFSKYFELLDKMKKFIVTSIIFSTMSDKS